MLLGEELKWPDSCYKCRTVMNDHQKEGQESLRTDIMTKVKMARPPKLDFYAPVCRGAFCSRCLQLCSGRSSKCYPQALRPKVCQEKALQDMFKQTLQTGSLAARMAFGRLHGPLVSKLDGTEALFPCCQQTPDTEPQHGP